MNVLLGDEFDDALRAKLMDVLRLLGATSMGVANRFIAGSQELEQFDVTIDGQWLHVEAETYVGLSLRGPADLVGRVKSLLTQ